MVTWRHHLAKGFNLGKDVMRRLDKSWYGFVFLNRKCTRNAPKGVITVPPDAYVAATKSRCFTLISYQRPHVALQLRASVKTVNYLIAP